MKVIKLQVKIPEDINIQLKIYKLKHNLITIADGVNEILLEHFIKNPEIPNIPKAKVAKVKVKEDNPEMPKEKK